MTRRISAPLLAALFLTGGAPALWSGPLSTQAGDMVAEPMVEGLEMPWAFGFLPDGTVLVTEKSGRLLSVSGGTRREITGLPRVRDDGQGGLLDLLVPRGFAEDRLLYMTFAKRQGFRGSGTAVYRARLSEDGTRLEEGETIFEIARGTGGGYHFGSRLVEAPDGALFVTIGDRGEGDLAQDLSMHNGSVLRITPQGAAAEGNPFASERGAQAEIWSYGHRNPQGAALDGSGQLWVVEHGAQGGDEVNRISAGANYGWPVVAYGVNYDGTKIGEGTEAPGMVQPVHYWDPSIAPSGMTFYDGTVEDWRGNAFIGSLKFDYISRLSGDPLAEVERLQNDDTIRVRDVRQGPEGALWFLSEGNGTLYRIAPE